MGVRSKTVNVELRSCVVQVEERGEGAPVLVLHGGKLDHRHMLDALEPLFDNEPGWRRLYVDLPGHGRSSAPKSVICQDDVLDILLELIDAIMPDERLAVIGESRGSYLARGIACKRPESVSGMALICPGGFTEEGAKRLPPHKTLVRAADLLKGLESDERGRFDRLVVQNAVILEKIRRTKIPASGLADASMEQRILDRYTFSFDLEALPPFPRPCLILSGRQDAVAGYHDAIDMLELYPRATYALLDRAGHSLSWEQPELFQALALEWLRRVREWR